jgi:hypothetical protein
LLALNQIQSLFRRRSKTQTTNSQADRINDLYAALWDQILRAIGRAVVNRQTKDWPKYFNDLRALTRRLIAEGTTSDLPASAKADLARRLVERIDQLEKYWLAPNATRSEHPQHDRFAKTNVRL